MDKSFLYPTYTYFGFGSVLDTFLICESNIHIQNILKVSSDYTLAYSLNPTRVRTTTVLL